MRDPNQAECEEAKGGERRIDTRNTRPEPPVHRSVSTAVPPFLVVLRHLRRCVVGAYFSAAALLLPARVLMPVEAASLTSSPASLASLSSASATATSGVMSSVFFAATALVFLTTTGLDAGRRNEKTDGSSRVSHSSRAYRK